jgi:S1-C subfamily serine protease
MPLLIALVSCFIFSMPSFVAHAQDQTAAQLMQTIAPSLVEVRAEATKTFTGDNGQKKVGTYHAQGSGVIIGSDGTIVTNTHIITGAARIFVGLSDGTVLEARLVYSSDADFSFLKVDPPYPLTAINWADSSLAVVGTPVIALSNADDNHQHILGGEITNLMDGISSNNVELFELNLNLYHGDSGGPLLDNQGNLLGLITAKRINEDNKSYAIASDKIQQEYLQYKQNPQS